MFAKTQELSEAIVLINGIDLAKFSKFVLKIVEKVDQNYTEIFSDEEENKLKSILSVTDTQNVKLIIKSVHYILKQIVYNLMKPRTVVKELTEIGLEMEKTVVFGEICNNYTPNLIEKLKDKSFDISNHRLADINWKLKMLTNQNSCDNKDAIPLAQIDLIIKGGQQSNQVVSIDFDRQELWNLYESLETIQSQLDSLHK